MPRFTASTQRTRLILAWLIVCVGFLGLLPAMAAQPGAMMAMDEICSIAMGQDGPQTQGDLDKSAVHSHQHCSVCAVASVAPPPAGHCIGTSVLADVRQPVPADLPYGAAPAVVWQARAPPQR